MHHGKLKEDGCDLLLKDISRTWQLVFDRRHLRQVWPSPETLTNNGGGNEIVYLHCEMTVVLCMLDLFYTSAPDGVTQWCALKPNTKLRASLSYPLKSRDRSYSTRLLYRVQTTLLSSSFLLLGKIFLLWALGCTALSMLTVSDELTLYITIPP